MLPQDPLDPPAAANWTPPGRVQPSTHPVPPARRVKTEAKKAAIPRTRIELRSVAQANRAAALTA